MDKYLKLLEKVATAKGIVFVFILTMLCFFVYKNLDFITEIKFTIDKSQGITKTQNSPIQNNVKKDEKQSLAMDLRFEKIELSPIDFKLPSYFLVEIKNHAPINTNEVDIQINFGDSSYERYEISPKDICKNLTDLNDKSILKIKCSNLIPNESVYIYAMLNHPVFNNISGVVKDRFRVGNIRTINYTYDNYKDSKRSKMSFFSGDVIGFFQFIFCVALIPLVGYLVLAILVFIEKLLKIFE